MAEIITLSTQLGGVDFNSGCKHNFKFTTLKTSPCSVN